VVEEKLGGGNSCKGVKVKRVTRRRLRKKKRIAEAAALDGGEKALLGEAFRDVQEKGK